MGREGKAEVGPSSTQIGPGVGPSFLQHAKRSTRRKVDETRQGKARQGIGITEPTTRAMAWITRRLVLQLRQCPSRIQCRATPRHTMQWQRPLSTSPVRRADEEADTKPTAVAKNEPSNPPGHAQLSPEEITARQLASLVEDLKAMDPEVVNDAIRKGKHGIPFGKDFELETDEDFALQEDDKRKSALGFWSEGEEDMGPDEDYYGDDLTSHGHGLLEQHRELRDYARLTAWELPLLNRMFLICIYIYIQTLLTPHRTRPPLHPPNLGHPIPLPLHVIPLGIAPSGQQSRC